MFTGVRSFWSASTSSARRVIPVQNNRRLEKSSCKFCSLKLIGVIETRSLASTIIFRI